MGGAALSAAAAAAGDTSGPVQDASQCRASFRGFKGKRIECFATTNRQDFNSLFQFLNQTLRDTIAASSDELHLGQRGAVAKSYALSFDSQATREMRFARFHDTTSELHDLIIIINISILHMIYQIR